jgi:hypothetical protein
VDNQALLVLIHHASALLQELPDSRECTLAGRCCPRKGWKHEVQCPPVEQGVALLPPPLSTAHPCRQAPSTSPFTVWTALVGLPL